jgi:hypothetical protein
MSSGGSGNRHPVLAKPCILQRAAAVSLILKVEVIVQMRLCIIQDDGYECVLAQISP